MESVSCKKKREIVYSWTKPVRFAIAGGARVKKDGLYKSLNYQLYIEKRKPPTPPYHFSCKRKIATNRSIEREREESFFLALELQDRLCAYLRYCFCTYKYIQTTYTIKEEKRKGRLKKKDMKR